jgi:histone H3/H4
MTTKNICAFTRFKLLVKTSPMDTTRLSQKGLLSLQVQVEGLVTKVLKLVVSGMGNKRKTVTKEDVLNVCRILSAGRYELNIPPPGVEINLPKSMGHNFLKKVDGKWRLSKTAVEGVSALYVAAVNKLCKVVMNTVDDSVKKIGPEMVMEVCEASTLVM